MHALAVLIPRDSLVPPSGPASLPARPQPTFADYPAWDMSASGKEIDCDSTIVARDPERGGGQESVGEPRLGFRYQLYRLLSHLLSLSR